MTKTSLMAGLLLAVAAAPVVAKDHGGPRFGEPHWDFEAIDADGDGLVTREEAAAFRAQRFAEVDDDGDGSVSLDEFTAHAVGLATARAVAIFGRLDADGDGALSRDVLEAKRRWGPSEDRIFARLDTDGDGAISTEEYEAALARHAEMRGRRHGGGEHGGGEHGGGPGARRN